MRIAVVLLLGVLACLAGGRDVRAQATEPQWRTVGSLSPAVRRVVERRLRDAEARERREARAATMDVGETLRVIVVRTPTTGTCGAFIYEVHRLQGETVAETPLATVCSDSLRFGPGNMDGVSDLRFAENEMVAAVWSWTGATWAPFRIDEEPRSANRRPVVSWEAISRLVGTYDVADLLYFPDVDAALRRILGERRVTLLANVGVRGPMSLVDDCLVLEGLRPHALGEEEGSVHVCPADRSVHAAILTQGRVFLGSTRPAEVALPDRLGAWIRGRLPSEASGLRTEALVDMRRP